MERVYWSDEETQAIIQIWSDQTVQAQLDGLGNMRNIHIYREISERLAQKGHVKSAEACRSKIKKLKAKYKECVAAMKKSGAARKRYRFFEELDEILGHRPEMNPANVIHMGVADKLDDSRSTASEETVSIGEEEDMDQSDGGEPDEGHPETTEEGHDEVEEAHDEAEEKVENDKPTPSTYDGKKSVKRRKKSKFDSSVGALTTELRDGEKRLIQEFREEERKNREWGQKLMEMKAAQKNKEKEDAEEKERQREERERKRQEAAEKREEKLEEERFERQMTLVNTVMTGLTGIIRELRQGNESSSLSAPTYYNL